jgi:hypothetical protein
LAIVALLLALSTVIAFLRPGNAVEFGDDNTIIIPSPSSAYFRMLIFQAQFSEAQYYVSTAQLSADIDRSANLGSAIEAWMQIWLCYGYAPAVEKIRELSRLDPIVECRVGFSPDLTIEADATWMELKNNAFDDYSIFLIRVVDRWYEPLVMDGCTVRILDTNGKWWQADAITPEHKLWQNVKRIGDTFNLHGSIKPGFTYTAKQVFATPGLREETIKRIVVETGRGSVVIPFVENIESGVG